ncbi:hypothetical protein D6C83_07155 [Aureobasidium pullulans]|uniref:Uncharacterized protein n=1 Tax=Aureobasidium pullulans TaxID=5580 RepID=A0A4T0B8Z1_AURPU|nr:hypothetical protein D6C83_07155 [Aureobasidium pullulans]
MAGLLGKKFPTPVARPMAPFYIAGAIIFYGINSLATTLANSQSTYSHTTSSVARLAAQTSTSCKHLTSAMAQS